MNPQQEIAVKPSLRLTERELQSILAHWDLPEDLPSRNVRILDGAKIAEHVWSVGDAYILKAGAREMQLRNLQIAKALAAQGLSAGTPITTRDGEDYVDGEHVFVLAHKLSGRPLSRPERFGDSRLDFGVQYGRARSIRDTLPMPLLSQ